MHIGFFKDALFAGMTSNAFRLGTVLHLGWFWPRLDGCSLLFRGTGIENIGFDNILAIDDYDVKLIQPPTYLEHLSDNAYYYVLRRVNSAGDMELTLSAAVKVAIDDSGQLAEPQPNSIFIVKTTIVDGSRAKLIWFYCPLQQHSAVASFNIYGDNGSGTIDYINALAQIPYQGRRFYSYISEQLQLGKYRFAIRSQDSSSTEDASLNVVSVEITGESPASIQFSKT